MNVMNESMTETCFVDDETVPTLKNFFQKASERFCEWIFEEEYSVQKIEIPHALPEFLKNYYISIANDLSKRSISKKQLNIL